MKQQRAPFAVVALFSLRLLTSFLALKVQDVLASQVPAAATSPAAAAHSSTPSGIASAVEAAAAAAATSIWLDTRRPVEARVTALLAAMTVEQKLAQLSSDASSAGVPSLGIPPFVWERECLHGMVNKGLGTMYPQPIAWAATFNPALARRAASEVGDELRAYNNHEVRSGRPPAQTNCFGPHVHVVRDPRWGRLSETYGEDPRLAADMARAFVGGLQAGDAASQYLKAGATCKHFILNDLEHWHAATRFNLNAEVAARDMRDTFLPPFQACVEAGATAVMCSYNAVNGLPSCANPKLLNGTLRRTLGFQGYVVTDCSAINRMTDPYPKGLGFAKTARASSAKALMAGTDMVCHEFNALDARDVSAADINRAAKRVLTARIRLGQLNPPSQQPFSDLQPSVIRSLAHKATARKLAAESIVLLKNSQGLLPLRLSKRSKLAVFGSFADQQAAIMGSYYNLPNAGVVTPLGALRAAVPPGAQVTFDSSTALVYTPSHVNADVARCRAADACIVFLGSRMWKFGHRDGPLPKNAYAPFAEGENLDRYTLRLNQLQEALWRALASRTNKPLVVVLIHGGPLDVSDLHASARVGAILTAWLPGEGAAAVAQVLLGQVSPSGRLPVTWPTESYTVLPMTDMRMRAAPGYPGRTHRYWRGPAPLYPFGYGLSYTTFRLSGASVAARGPAGATASIQLSNVGGVAADNVVLLLMSYLGPAVPSGSGLPRARVVGSGCSRASSHTDLVQALAGYQRVSQLAPGDLTRLTFNLSLAGGSSSAWAGFGDPTPPCGAYSLTFGAHQPAAAVVLLA